MGNDDDIEAIREERDRLRAALRDVVTVIEAVRRYIKVSRPRYRIAPEPNFTALVTEIDYVGLPNLERLLGPESEAG